MCAPFNFLPQEVNSKIHKNAVTEKKSCLEEDISKTCVPRNSRFEHSGNFC